jgi:UDP-3-O-[3-hydroxymyristoyl] glucosamine N-acyltransferase
LKADAHVDINEMAPNPQIVIVGAGDTGADIAELVAAAGSFDLAGFVDDATETIASPVIGTTADLGDLHDAGIRTAVLALSLDRSARVRIGELLTILGYSTPAIVHPNAEVSATAVLAPGSIVFPFASIAQGVTVGRYTLVKRFSRLSYRSSLGDYVTVAPYAFVGPRAVIGDRVLLRAHTIVRAGRTVGPDSDIDSLISVIDNVPARSRVAAPSVLSRLGDDDP